VSDLEVDYVEEEGKLYYFKYMLDGEEEGAHIPVATTRPEVTVRVRVRVRVRTLTLTLTRWPPRGPRRSSATPPCASTPRTSGTPLVRVRVRVRARVRVRVRVRVPCACTP